MINHDKSSMMSNRLLDSLEDVQDSPVFTGGVGSFRSVGRVG